MDVQKGILLITYSPEVVDGEPIYISSNCLPIKASNLEPAGHSFHAAALKTLGFIEEEEADTDDQSVSSGDQGPTYIPSSDSYSTKGKKKSGSKQQDHYALLGLGHLRFLATEEQIRKSYRETALKYHPDKQTALLFAEETEEARQSKKDEIENHFKSIQEAYEVLVDRDRRRLYDSTDEFDDEVPTDCAPQDFFKVFGLAFMRNARWSVTQPVPSLGDDRTTFEEADDFYNFWYGFKSWREFPHADEFDLEQAESRDHKRWMERQNVKLKEKAKKEEYARVRGLVENAYKRDPRILKRKEEEKAEKQRKKEAKYLAKKQQEEEANRAAEEERRRKEEDERRAAEAALIQKKLREKEKKALRKERARLRTISSSVVSGKFLGLLNDDVEKLCMSLEFEPLKHLCDEMERNEGRNERARLLKAALDGGSSNQVADPVPKTNGYIAQVKPPDPVIDSVKKEKPWGKEEIEMLRKGTLKYPKGTSRRWEVISEYIGTERSVEEILKATKTVLLQKPDSAKAFDSFLEKRKTTQPIESPLSTRFESVGLKPDKVEAINTSKATSSMVPGKPEGKLDLGLNGVPSLAEQDVWSATQERSLVQALKTFPKEDSQRWERVSLSVPGKTVAQCRKKLAMMKVDFRSKKTGD